MPGCAGDGTSRTGGTDAASYAPEENSAYNTYRRLGYRLEWSSRTVVSSRSRVEQVMTYRDIVLTQDGSNTVTLLESTDGAVRWSADLAGDLEQFVGLDRLVMGDSRRVVACSESEIYLLDERTGDLRDRQKLTELVNTPPTMTAGGLAVFGCPTSRVICQDVVRRARGWAYGVNGAVTSRPVVVSGNVVGLVSQGGDVLFLDAVKGTGRGITRIYGGLANNPVSDGSAMYVASLDQSIWAIEPFGADRIRWRNRYEQPITAQPVLHGDTLYVTIPGKGLTSLDTATGVTNWDNPEVDGDVIAIRDGRPLVWNGSDAVLVDPRHGRVIERETLDDVQILRADEFVDGNLITVARDGTVKKYSPR